MNLPVQLWDHQAKAIDMIKDSFRKGYKYPFVASPTGSGKTHMISAIAWLSLQKGSRVGVLAHREEIINQIFERFGLFGIRPGMIKAGRKYDGSPSWVAMRQTLANRKLPVLKTEKSGGILIIDEAHLIRGNQYSELIKHYRSEGARVIFFSATPQRADGKGMDDLRDMLVEGAPVLGEKGHETVADIEKVIVALLALLGVSTPPVDEE